MVAALILSQHPEDDEDFARSNVSVIGSRWRGRALLFTGDLAQLDPLFSA
jgi:hypothetical protein